MKTSHNSFDLISSSIQIEEAFHYALAQIRIDAVCNSITNTKLKEFDKRISRLNNVCTKLIVQLGKDLDATK